MKVIVNESLGLEYTWDVISSCDQNGMQAIADNQNNEILFYDPKNKKYCTNKDLMNADFSIHDVFTDKSVRDQVMKPTSGKGFEDFATKWDALQKSDDQDVIKTKNCSMIRFDAHESGKSRSSMKGGYIGKERVYEAFGGSHDLPEVELGDSDFDRLNEYLEDMAQSYWEEDNMGGGGKSEMLTNLYSDVLQWLNDRGLTKHNHSPITLVVDGAQIPARDLAKEILDQVYKENEDSYTGYGENTYMNESGSDGGTIDVTIKFTNGHYGKKLKTGDERTIKLDTSTAPTMYDTDDMLTWIAEVASDQIPGGGEVTKYDFETIDPPDDVLIKAVMGDEGFGPDVDVDFEDFDPKDVPSEISYRDALKFYRKMDKAYDDRKLNYTKFDQIRNKLMAAVVKGLLKEKSLDELADEWFINYGTMNGWGWKTSFKYNVACALHDIHKKKHPDEHVVDREDTIRGWHSEKCSCGLASSSDSSD